MFRAFLSLYFYTIKTNKMKNSINLNTNKQTIKELESLGITNYYKSQPLCIQRQRLLRDAFNKGLITLNA